MNIVNGVCVDGGRGRGQSVYPGLKCPPPSTSCMLSFVCNDQRDSEEPDHLKFLNALQEDAGNNVSYLVPYEHSQ